MNAMLEVPAKVGRDQRMAAKKREPVLLTIDLTEPMNIEQLAARNPREVAVAKATHLARQLLSMAQVLTKIGDVGGRFGTDENRHLMESTIIDPCVSNIEELWAVHLGMNPRIQKERKFLVKRAIESLCREAAETETPPDGTDLEAIGVLTLLKLYFTPDQQRELQCSGLLIIELIQLIQAMRDDKERKAQKGGRGKKNATNPALMKVFERLGLETKIKSYQSSRRSNRSRPKKL